MKYDLSSCVKPFKESEVSNVDLANFNIHLLIDKHQMCIEILEAIMRFEQQKKHKIESIEGFAGTFPDLRKKYVNDIDTINRCIKRLKQRYNHALIGSHETSQEIEDQFEAFKKWAENKVKEI